MCSSDLWLIVCAWPFLIALIKGLYNRDDAGDKRSEERTHDDQSLAKLWGSFRAFNESIARNQGIFFFQWIATVYFALRLAISFMLELIGLSFLWSIRMIAAICLFTYRFFRTFLGDFGPG